MDESAVTGESAPVVREAGGDRSAVTGGTRLLSDWLIVPVLAIAGSLVQKKKVPASAGTLPTHTPLFIAWLIGVIMIVGALSFIPALALGPIVEHLMVFGH